MILIKYLVLIALLFICSGCNSQHDIINDQINPIYTNISSDEQINLFAVDPILKTNSVYTTEKKVALTFNGLPNYEKCLSVLQLLEQHNIIATFFVPGIRAAEEPHLIELILKAGHKVENNTLNKIDLTTYTEEQIYSEVSLGKSTIERVANKEVKYLRAETSQFELPILKSAAKSNHERYIGYSLYMTDAQLTNQFYTVKDLRKYIQRGAIIAIDLDRNEQIEAMLNLLMEAVTEVKYEFVTVENLIAAELPKKPYYDIEGYDLVGKYEVSATQTYNLFYKGNEQKKQVALTIDDWGTDYTISRILDILAEKSVVGSFYLRANGVEANPSLARSILEAGHEIANHTYSHPVITTITKEQLQEELVKSHYVITEALQQPPSMFFRPPTGAINDEAAKIVAATGYFNIAMYDVTTLDWDPSVTAEEIVQIIKDKVTNGSIILLHMLDDTNTLEALPTIIDYLLINEYDIVTTADILK